jgi:methyl-accepting chemotaxis protein
MPSQSLNHDIARQLQIFALDEGDFSRFSGIAKSIAKHAPKILDSFYEGIRADPEQAAMFTSPAMMSSARAKQLEHWAELFSGTIDGAYLERAERIGLTHARIGLKPSYYIGGYAKVLADFIEREIGGSITGRAKARKLATLVKTALLDMEIATSAYIKAQDEARERVLQSLAQALAKVSHGDLTTKLQGLPKEFEQVRFDFESMCECIDQALSGVSQTSEQIRVGSSEIRAASDDLSQRTESQAAALEETAAALDQLTAGVNRAAKGASEVNHSVTETEAEAREGGKVVTEAVAAMDGIQKSAQEIGSIVNVIDSIAFQTNLLALNAGVEAARAGDAGKGFAVVANEVRALAQRSAEAAQNIKDLIGGSVRQVERGVSLVGRSGEVFGRIVEKVSGVTELASSISELAQEQAQQLSQVNAAVGDMDRMTQQNAAMVEETTAAARNLAQQSEDLAKLVTMFKLAGAVPSSMGNVTPMATARPMPGAQHAAPRTSGTLALKPQTLEQDDWSEF